jgi:hypothetical protein
MFPMAPHAATATAEPRQQSRDRQGSGRTGLTVVYLITFVPIDRALNRNSLCTREEYLPRYSRENRVDRDAGAGE